MKDKYKEYIQFIANDIEAPYHKNMETYGIKQDDYHLVLSELYGSPVSVKFGSIIYDTNGNEIYHEDSDGNWYKQEYDSNNKIIYSEYSDGYWYRREYDTNGNIIYWENSNGFWNKWEYDGEGCLTAVKDNG